MSRRDYARIVPNRDGSLSFFSSYDPSLVDALKSRIPWQERKWDRDEKCWRVDPAHTQVLADIALSYLGIAVTIPAIRPVQQDTIEMLKLEYLGTAKERQGGDWTAYGWVNDNWNAAFSLDVLKQWFNIAQQDVNAPVTLYGVLGVSSAACGKEIKKAYRRAAKQWHPDINKEANAAEQFMKIKAAYDTLENPLQRRKYDAGLAFEASLPKGAAGNKVAQKGDWWYPPLRCGWVTVRTIQSLGRYNVLAILDWSDITRGRLTMVSHWPRDADHFSVNWV
jgi:hypothetical protein